MLPATARKSLTSLPQHANRHAHLRDAHPGAKHGLATDVSVAPEILAFARPDHARHLLRQAEQPGRRGGFLLSDDGAWVSGRDRSISGGALLRER
jgi:hypothetical protein